MRLCMCIMRSRCWGGVFEPVEPPIEKPETPTTPPSTENLLTIKIEENIMAVVGTETWYDIAYGNGKFVAVGDNGYITTSTNGTSWTTPKQVGTTRWLKVVYGNGKFFAITSSNKSIRSSTDGITWTDAVTMPSSPNDIAYGDGKLVIACYSGKLYTSTDDGKTWTNTYSYSTYTWKLVIYANGKFVAINSSNGDAVYSEDGITWKSGGHAANSNYVISDIAFGNNKYVLVGNSSTNKGMVCTSEDAITWKTNYQNLSLKVITYCNGTFISIGSVYANSKHTYYMITSIDGIVWTNMEEFKDEFGNAVPNIVGICAMP